MKSEIDLPDLRPGESYGADVLAAIFELSPRSIRELAAAGVIPRATRGKYPLEASVRCYIDHLRRRTIAHCAHCRHTVR